MTNDRDPRINPRPGDSLTCGPFVTTIVHRRSGSLMVRCGTAQSGIRRQHQYQAWTLADWRAACEQEAAVVKTRGS